MNTAGKSPRFAFADSYKSACLAGVSFLQWPSACLLLWKYDRAETLGGMTPPAPRSPYASSAGMIKVRFPPSCIMNIASVLVC